MAGLSRTEKYKDLRTRLQDDTGNDLSTKALNPYESRLNQIDSNNFAAPGDVLDDEHSAVHVAGYAYEAGKPTIIVVNKWDAVEKDTHTMAAFTEKIRNEFAYLSYAPIVFVSAKTHQRVDTIVPMVDKVFENSSRRIPTNILNQVIADTQVTNPAPARNGKRFRIYYVTQVANQPPTFVLSCH